LSGHIRFDDDRFIFELKHDGFRAVAHVTADGCRLVSRHGNAYKSFMALSESLASLERSAVLDGEIVVLDATGRSQFYELLRRRSEPDSIGSPIASVSACRRRVAMPS
jgi:bifunctional non-homologous end joining protein LigD